MVGDDVSCHNVQAISDATKWHITNSMAAVTPYFIYMCRMYTLHPILVNGRSLERYSRENYDGLVMSNNPRLVMELRGNMSEPKLDSCKMTYHGKGSVRGHTQKHRNHSYCSCPMPRQGIILHLKMSKVSGCRQRGRPPSIPPKTSFSWNARRKAHHFLHVEPRFHLHA